MRIDLAWYEKVEPDISITQGDLIVNCPVVSWQSGEIKIEEGKKEEETLQGVAKVQYADLIVMTQACDLEHGKVVNAVLCPYFTVTKFREIWENKMRGKEENITAKAWKRACADIRDGHAWDLAMLNDDKRKDFGLEILIVDFHEIFTLPVSFIQSIQSNRRKARFRLLPPYREHLSQAFARYFMRVGLPTPISDDWKNIS